MLVSGLSQLPGLPAEKSEPEGRLWQMCPEAASHLSPSLSLSLSLPL
jgi:hypothetical protein